MERRLKDAEVRAAARADRTDGEEQVARLKEAHDTLRRNFTKLEGDYSDVLVMLACLEIEKNALTDALREASGSPSKARSDAVAHLQAAQAGRGR